MKTLLITGLLAVGFSLNAFAKAGEGVGNGGGAWVCQNKDRLQTIRWTRLVDLYEAEKEFLLPMKSFENRSYRDIIDFQKVRLFSIDKNLYESLIPYFEGVDENINEVPADLEIIDDALFRVRPPARDCLGGEIKYIQLANFTHYGTILINKYLFNNPKLSEVDKAALIFHEAIYVYLRDRYKDNTSVRTREIVGYIFSNLKNSKISEKLNEVLGLRSIKDLGMEFVTIPKGSFMMGSPEDEPGRFTNEKQRHVTITHNYEMMTTEVTQAMYLEVTGENPSVYSEDYSCPLSFETRVVQRTGKKVNLCPNNPVERVSFDEAQIFIALLNEKTGLNYRLPTEAEWEYAARAGSTSAYFFGDDPALLKDYAIFQGNYADGPQPVGPMRSYANKPNPYGLYDMYGNVKELTQDRYTKSPLGGIDPMGPDTGYYRVLRGGSIISRPRGLRSAFRDDQGFYIGFRLARTLP